MKLSNAGIDSHYRSASAKKDSGNAGHWTPYIIEYRGVMDLEGLCRLIIKWFQDRSFEFHETTYKHKPGMIGKEQEMKWEAWQKMNEYIRQWFDVYMHVWDIQEIDVVKEEQKVKMIKARIRILINGYVERDWQKTFGKNRLLKRIMKFYDGYIVYKDMTGIWADMVHYKIAKLHNEIKEF